MSISYKKHASTSLLLLSLFMVTTMKADGIRLYQDSDHAPLRAMVAGNDELLLPGKNREEQIAQTAKYLGSKNYTTKVFVKDDKPVGFITYQKEVSTNWLLQKIVGSPGVIQLFNVVAQHRRKGIGAALLADALADMKQKNFDVVMVQTKVTNDASRALYEKSGFALLSPVVAGIADCIYTCKLSDQEL